SYTSIIEGYSGSDHFSFKYDAEIPTISFFSNDKSRINTRSDTIEFINPVLLGDMVVLVLELLASLEDL
ncbi:MAG: Zn-dependent exopeptidase M28, partial [Gammaproteobacteria bacterium]|nr:Zn-dependent exopeptidase M28 [Gammaproteobacteria bacterium]